MSTSEKAMEAWLQAAREEAQAYLGATEVDLSGLLALVRSTDGPEPKMFHVHGVTLGQRASLDPVTRERDHGAPVIFCVRIANEPSQAVELGTSADGWDAAAQAAWAKWRARHAARTTESHGG